MKVLLTVAFVIFLQSLDFVLAEDDPWQTVAGTGRSGFGGNTYHNKVHGFGIESRLNSPWGLALDTSHDLLYIADTLNHVVRSLDLQTGLLETIAGTGVAGYKEDTDAAVEALFNMPTGLALDVGLQKLYVVDMNNHRVRVIDLRPGVVYQAEENQTDSGGNPSDTVRLEGPEARLSCPTSGSPNASSLLFGSGYCAGSTGGGHATYLNSIKDRIDFTVFASAGAGTYDLRFRYADRHSQDRKMRLLVNGIVLTHQLAFPVSGYRTRHQAGSYSHFVWSSFMANLVTGGNTVTLEVTGHGGPRVDLLFVVPDRPLVQTVLGTGLPSKPSPDDVGTPQTATASSVQAPLGLALDEARQVLYVADAGNGRVRRVHLASGTVTTVAGGASGAPSGDGRNAATGKLFRPSGLILDSAGDNLYFTDEMANKVRRIDLTTMPPAGGTITTVCGAGTGFAPFVHILRNPQDLVLDEANGVIYIADRENARIRYASLSGSCPAEITPPMLEQDCSFASADQTLCLSLGCCFAATCGTQPNQDGRANVSGFKPLDVLTKVDQANHMPPISFVRGGTGRCCHPHLREMSTFEVLDSPQGLVLDPVNRLLYVTQAELHKVVRLHLDAGRCSSGSGLC